MSKVIKSVHSKSSFKQAKQIVIRKLSEDESFQPLIHAEEEQHEESFSSASTINSNDTDKIVKQKLDEADQKVKQMIEDAELHIKEMYEQIEFDKSEAIKEQEYMYEQMREEGYQAGLLKGREDGFNEYKESIEEANSIIMSAKDEYHKVVEQAEPVIVDLAVELCRRVIGHGLVGLPEVWDQFVKQVIKEVQEHEDVKIYVHPDWFERTRQQKEELHLFLTHCEELYIYADPALAENGCVIETKYGRMDATIDHQLTQLKKQLHDRLEEA